MLVAETESVCAITGASSFNSHHGESLGHLKKLTILADSDDAGEQLKLRILRHTGGCVTDFRKYPDGCKDGNDWLLMEAQK
jgi:5S rRNA maturation endonuclease (ribonuclease M5)